MTDMLGPYQLNTIVTGDARELSKAIPDESVDLIFTDPPWGVEYKYPSEFVDSWEGYKDFVEWLVGECQRILRPGAFAFVYQGTKRLQDTYSIFPSGSRLFADCKTFIQLKGLPVEFAVDYIVFWQKLGLFALTGMCRDWHRANTSRTIHKSRDTKLWLTNGAKIPPPRPLESCVYIINQMCLQGAIVMDFFVGSGTTAVACKVLGRNYLAFEIDPETAEIARQRVVQTQPPLFVQKQEQLSLNIGDE